MLLIVAVALAAWVRPGHVPRVRSPAAPAIVAVGTAAAPATDPQRLLALIEETDRGVAASEDLRVQITSLIERLEAAWSGTDAFDPSQRDFLLRRTEVAYVGQTNSARANAAGGRYRGRWGRLLFRTEALFQHVLADSVAVNVIQFKLLGLLAGCAVLPGEWYRPSAEQVHARHCLL